MWGSKTLRLNHSVTITLIGTLELQNNAKLHNCMHKTMRAWKSGGDDKYPTLPPEAEFQLQLRNCLFSAWWITFFYTIFGIKPLFQIRKCPLSRGYCFLEPLVRLGGQF